MRKKNLIFIVILIIFLMGLVLLSIFTRNLQKTGPGVSPSITLLPTFTKQPTVSFQVSPTILSVPTIMISQVPVNDFFKTGKTVNKNGDVLITDNDQFQILYLKPFNQFLISILSPSYEEARIKAERQFLLSLGISMDEACRLNVRLNTPQFVNPELAGRDYPLSFCRKK